MNTQKIPFSIEKMKDAVRYETRDGREVTQVTVFDIESTYSTVAALNGKAIWFTNEGARSFLSKSPADLFIIIEKPVQYPCLCWVSDACKDPGKNNSECIDMMRDENLSLSDAPCHWYGSTPITDEELAELGLMRAEK